MFSKWLSQALFLAYVKFQRSEGLLFQIEIEILYATEKYDTLPHLPVVSSRRKPFKDEDGEGGRIDAHEPNHHPRRRIKVV